MFYEWEASQVVLVSKQPHASAVSLCHHMPLESEPDESQSRLVSTGGDYTQTQLGGGVGRWKMVFWRK